MKQEIKENAKAMGCLGAWWFYVVILVAIVSLVGLVVRPYILDLQNKQNQHTYEYVTSVKESLISSYTEWKQLDAEIKENSDNPNVVAAKKANQAAIVVDMRQKALRIDPSEVPGEIAQFLATH